jgi:hypothetical protein
MTEIDEDIRVGPFGGLQIGLGIASGIFLVPALALLAVAGFFSWSLSEIRNAPAPNGPAGMIVVTWLLIGIFGLLSLTSGTGLVFGIAGIALGPKHRSRLPIALPSALHLLFFVGAIVGVMCVLWVVN